MCSPSLRQAEKGSHDTQGGHMRDNIENKPRLPTTGNLRMAEKGLHLRDETKKKRQKYTVLILYDIYFIEKNVCLVSI